MGDSAPDSATPRRWGAATVLAAAAAVVFSQIATADAARRIRSIGLPASTGPWAIAGLICLTYVVQIALLVVIVRLSGSRLSQPGLFERVRLKPIVGAAVAIAVIGRLAVAAWEVVLRFWGVVPVGQRADVAGLFPPGLGGFAMAMLATVVLAPLAEELVFRGILLGALEQRWGRKVAVWGSAAAFAVVHLSPYVVAPVFVFGLLLGEFYVRTRTLRATVIAHATFNLIATVALFAAQTAGLL